MKSGQLSLDQAPAYSIPLRFFVTAPLFGAGAAVLLLWYGPAGLSSRWNPAVLAATHFMTLGFATMVMCGALLQLLPVLIGARISQPRRVAGLVHGMLTGGVLSLGFAFLSGRYQLFGVALVLLGGAVVVLVVSAGVALRRTLSSHPTMLTMTLALLALVVTLLSGAYKVLSRIAAVADSSQLITSAHLAWGMLGWIGLLVMSVAFQVVPMFQMTREYPAVLTRRLGLVVLILLVLWTLAGSVTEAVVRQPLLAGLGMLLALAYAGFAIVTLRLQQHRRRRLPDVTLWYWRVGMLALLVTIMLWLAGVWYPSFAARPYQPLLIGIVMIFGFITALVSGMLYKIVPFLGWLHLHSSLHTRAERRARLPNMKDFIPEKAARRQFYVYLLALILLTGAALRPVWFAYPAALAWLLACVLLWLNLYNAVRLYRRLAPG